ncbi:MAG: hypothetical protein AAGF24_06860 [Cyanobacteria bacterium P01_H01_bin.121]
MPIMQTVIAPPPLPRQRPPGTPPDWIDPEFKPESEQEADFAALWVHLYPEIDLHAHHRFRGDRRFELDFAHIPSQTGIEIQGGIWNPQMGHSTGKGIHRDCDKAIAAAEVGWLILPLPTDKINVDELTRIARAIQGRLPKLAEPVALY